MKSRAFARTVLLGLTLVACGLASAPSPGRAASDTALQSALEQAVTGYLGAPPSSGMILTRLEQADGWVFGLVTLPAPAARHDHPRTMRWVAKAIEGGWEVALEPTAHYRQLWAEASARLLPAAVHALGEGGQSRLSLPWATGESWRLSGGPHGQWLEALDFSEGSGQVRAAREGIAYRPCPNMVVLYHEDGWQTGYYHLADIAVAHGEAVARGQLLGRGWVGTGCGGWATDSHLHFWIQLNGEPIAMHGQVIGGWTVYNGAAPYLGCMGRAEALQCAGSGYLYNDGAIGDELPPPSSPEPEPPTTEPPAPAPEPPPGEEAPEMSVLVADTDDPNAERGGVIEYFFPSFGGLVNHQGLATWTVSSPDLVYNYMKWKPPLPRCGYWEVFAYLPLIYNGLFDTTNAVYSIRHRLGNRPAAADDLRQINMEALTEELGYDQSDRWVSLGTYLWSAGAHQAGEYILLSDLTGETELRSVNFDAMRWVFRGDDPAACAA